jgi:hypothetical protein
MLKYTLIFSYMSSDRSPMSYMCCVYTDVYMLYFVVLWREVLRCFFEKFVLDMKLMELSECFLYVYW